MVVEDVQDAAWQEMQSVGIFSAAMVSVNEVALQLGVKSPVVLIAGYILVMAANVYWQYRDNGHQMERLTISKQMSRLGVNTTILFVGLGVYGLVLGLLGIKQDKDFSNHLRITGKDANFATPILAYAAAAIVYAINRGVINLVLLLVAVVQYFIG